MLVAVARDIYGEHFDDLDEGRRGRVLDFCALRWIENDELEKLKPKTGE